MFAIIVYYECIKNYLPDIKPDLELASLGALGLFKYKEYNLNDSLMYYKNLFDKTLDFQGKCSESSHLYDVYTYFSPKIMLCSDERHIYDRLGELHIRSGNYDEAIKIYEDQEIFQHGYNQIAELWSSYNLGRVFYLMGDLRSCEVSLLESLKGFEKLSNYEGIASTYGELSCVYQCQGKMQKSVDALHKCISICIENENISETLFYLNRLGRLYQDQGFYDVADDIFFNCVLYLKYNKGNEHLGWVCNNYGRNFMYMNDYKSADTFLERAKKIFEASNNNKGISYVLNDFGELKYKTGKPSQAIDYLLKSYNMKKKMGDQYAICYTCRELGEYYISINKPDEAKPYLYEALSLCKTLGFKEKLGDVYLSYAKVFNKKGQHLLQRKHLKKAIKIYKQQNLPKRTIDCYKLALDFERKKGRLKTGLIFRIKYKNAKKNYDNDTAFLISHVDILKDMLEIKTHKYNN